MYVESLVIESAMVKLMIQSFYEADYTPKFPGLDQRLSDHEEHWGRDETYCLTGHRSCLTTADDHKCEDACYVANGEACAKEVCAVSRKASDILTHAKVYVLADKYDIVSLKNLAEQKFKRK